MEKFIYKAYDSSGVMKQGEISAVNSESAVFKLKEGGFTPVEIHEAAKSGFWYSDHLRIEFKPGINQIEEFTSRLFLLLKNGIKVDKAFEFALKGIQNHRLKNILTMVHDDIRKGIKLTDALGKYPDVFDSLYVSIVKIGEETGNLAQAFADITDSLSFHRSILSKTKQALIYPFIIFLVCIGSILFVFNFIVPRFSVIFAENPNLPIYTQILVTISDFFCRYQFVIFPLLILAGLGIYLNKDRSSVKKIKYLLAANLPVVKKLSFTLENLRFASALSMLLSTGVVLSEALKHAIDSVSNTFIKRRLASVQKGVRQGGNLSELLSNAGFLPDMFDGLVEVGERTGNLAEVFKEMEIRLKSDYEKSMASLIALIEPVLILVMGIIIGSVVLVMLLSIVSVNDIDF